MCDHAHAFAAAFRACGVDAEALPESTAPAAGLGRKLTLGKECFPCLLTIGDIVSKIKSPGFDRRNAAFFMPSASGPCRFGQYHRFQRMVLDQLGYRDIPLFSPDARNSYANFGFLDNGQRFRKLGWQGLVGTDLLFRLRCRIKPYEKRAGETEALYRETLQTLAGAIERQEDICDAIGRCADMFARIETDRSRSKPVVGVVGEIYLRQNRYANNRLVATLEDLGAEVALAPMIEWILYTNYTYKRRLFRERKWRDLGKAVLTDIYQRSIERRFTREVNKRIHLEHEPPIEKVVELASPYLDKSFLGEAILSIGKSIDYYLRGARGIVNAMPFTCMPGTIVTAISRKVRRDCGNIPWLNMFYEGLEMDNDATRLEAFVYQAARFRAQVNQGPALTECDADSERRSDRSRPLSAGKESLPVD
jgi:predicted nucleotide-binding protein (sugar kinase/HSP70/actin superfamily)